MPDGRTAKREVRCPDCGHFLMEEGMSGGEVVVICFYCKGRVVVQPGTTRVIQHGQARRGKARRRPGVAST